MISLAHVDVCRWPMLLLLLCSTPRLSTMCLVRFSWCLVLHRRSCISFSSSIVLKVSRIVIWGSILEFRVQEQLLLYLAGCGNVQWKIHIISIVNKSFILCFSTFLLCYDENEKCDEQEEKLKKNEILRHLAAFSWGKLSFFSYSFSFWFKSWLFFLTHSITSDAFALLTHFIHKRKKSLFVHSHSSMVLRRCRVKLWKL